MDALNSRVAALEKDISSMRNTFSQEIITVRGDFENVIERHSVVLENVGKQIETALKYQRDSLPIGLVMRLFTFFSVLNVGIFSAVLGIKWVDTKYFDGSTQKQEVGTQQ